MLRRNSFSFVSTSPGFVYNVFWDQTEAVEQEILQVAANKQTLRQNITYVLKNVVYVNAEHETWKKALPRSRVPNYKIIMTN